MPGAQKNFNTKSADAYSTFGTPFDYDSLMMYNPTDYGILDSAGNRQTTIEPLKPGVTIGQLEAKMDLSLVDKIELGRLYQKDTAVSCFKPETILEYATYLVPELELLQPQQRPAGPSSEAPSNAEESVILITGGMVGGERHLGKSRQLLGREKTFLWRSCSP